MVGSSSYIGTSTNGTSWTKQTANGGYLTDVIFAGDKFRTVGQEGLYTESSDGTNWTTKRFAHDIKLCIKNCIWYKYSSICRCKWYNI